MSRPHSSKAPAGGGVMLPHPSSPPAHFPDRNMQSSDAPRSDAPRSNAPRSDAPRSNAPRSHAPHHRAILENSNARRSTLERSTLERSTLERSTPRRPPRNLGGCLAFLLITGLITFHTSASTITGNIRDTSGNAFATNALFSPLSTPQADGNNVIASTQTNVIADATGAFSLVLKQGNYKVTIGNNAKDSFIIAVPNDSNTYQLTALITSQLTYTFTTAPAFDILRNFDTNQFATPGASVALKSGLRATNLYHDGSIILSNSNATRPTRFIGPPIPSTNDFQWEDASGVPYANIRQPSVPPDSNTLARLIQVPRSSAPALANTAAAIRAGRQLVIAHFGDSLNCQDGGTDQWMERAAQDYGFCGCEGAAQNSSFTGIGLRCGVDYGAGTFFATDFNKSFWQYAVLPSAGAFYKLGAYVAGVSFAGQGMTGNVFSVEYWSSNTLGGFSITTNNTLVTNIVCNAAPGLGLKKIWWFTNAAPVKVILQLQSLSNECDIISIGIRDTTHPGIVVVQQSQPAQDISQFNVVPTNNWGLALAARRPDLVTIKTVNSTGAIVSNNIPAMHAALRYYAPFADILYEGPQANNVDIATVISINVAEKAWAATNADTYFFPGYDLMGADSTVIINEGWALTGNVHLTAEGALKWAWELDNWLNLFGKVGQHAGPPDGRFPNVPHFAGLRLGANGVILTNILGGSAVLDFPSTAPSKSSDLSISVPGTGTNDVVLPGVPAICAITNTSYFYFPSNDTVWVRFQNNDTNTTQNPGPALFKAVVIKY